ncbi:hypothetical protein [Halobellus inordinatus]|uniref:hypothetical protein n=1 Tax=Halobellus inordinatus TaxID=1126236 RepID=UPI002113A4CB|nr:hypothetical protein [Halobellus ramosii]
MSDDGSDSNDLYKLGAIAAAFYLWSGAEIPDWWLLAGTGLGAAVVVGAIASGKINDLLDDPRSKRIVQVNANGEELAAWKLSADKLAETQIEWGPLYPHDTGSKYDVLEAYAYDPERNVAVGTWRRSIPSSEIVGQHDVEDVLNVLEDTRGRLEVMAREGRELKTQLPNIVRRIDFERMEMQNAALDPNEAMPSETLSLEQVMREELPEELQPGSIKNADLSTLLDAENNQEEPWEADAVDLLIDDSGGEALEPVGEPLNDGGTV